MTGAPAEPTRERRWLLVTSDGKHVTLGRARDPSPDELETAAARLGELNLAGWLAVSEGHYYGPGPLRLMMVRSLAEVAGATWSDAEAAFMSAREVECEEARHDVPDP